MTYQFICHSEKCKHHCDGCFRNCSKDKPIVKDGVCYDYVKSAPHSKKIN